MAIRGHPWPSVAIRGDYLESADDPSNGLIERRHETPHLSQPEEGVRRGIVQVDEALRSLNRPMDELEGQIQEERRREIV